MLANPAVNAIVVGAKNPSEVEQNIQATRQEPLPRDVHQAVDHVRASDEDNGRATALGRSRMTT